MTEEYSIEVHRYLEKEFNQLALHRPMRIERCVCMRNDLSRSV